MNEENNDGMVVPVVVEVQDNNWKKDSVGCLHLRTLELADSLIIANNLLGKPSNEFIIVFGKPNRIVEDNTKKFFVYYIKTFCRNGKRL